MCTGEHTLRSAYLLLEFSPSAHTLIRAHASLHMHYPHMYTYSGAPAYPWTSHHNTLMPTHVHTHISRHTHSGTAACPWTCCHTHTHTQVCQTDDSPAHWPPSNSRQFVELQELHRNSDPFRKGWPDYHCCGRDIDAWIHADSTSLSVHLRALQCSLCLCIWDVVGFARLFRSCVNVL